MADFAIIDNRAGHRFETQVDGVLCVLDYRREGASLQLDHVGVPDAVGGRGIAAALTEAAMQTARREDLRIVPHCSYVAAWLRRHPAYADLVG
jgi:predicted GNAT family acetyltransferase